ncbi:helix-turn-helix transcriptional regulator [Streptomyces sp. NPDC048606]|uniref:helix-turn-helix transcriptional regulator n=1 Tax=Streptomyces sp. NPDC048606 TaxID=3154726 RepID=UPI00341DDB68
MPADFGHLLLQLRLKARRTQEQQAHAINAVSGRASVTRREINRYEHGENIPTNHTLAHIAVACGLPPGELQREAAAARARRRNLRHREGEETEVLNRRRLMGGALVSAAVATEPWGRLANALGKGAKIDEQSADALSGRARALHISEHHLTAHQLRGQVESHLDAITAALPRAGQHERALTIAAGETAALAGWLAWDLGDHRTARSYYKVTTDCAEVAGHPPLRALALGYASYGADRPNRAVELLAKAAEHVRGPGNGAAAAWIHARHAEETANAGDDTAALRALDRALTAYDFADHTTEQAWVQFMTPARMDALVLSVYGRLGHRQLPQTAASTAQRLGPDLSDSGVVILGDLAHALLQGGDIGHGVHVAHQFAAAAQTRPNTMGRARAAAVAARLPNSERDLAHHLQGLAA